MTVAHLGRSIVPGVDALQIEASPCVAVVAGQLDSEGRGVAVDREPLDPPVILREADRIRGPRGTSRNCRRRTLQRPPAPSALHPIPLDTSLFGWPEASDAAARLRRLIAERSHAAGGVVEAGVLAEEHQPLRTDRPGAVLGDDHLGRALVGRLRVVHLVAVQEHHHVGVLLERAGLTQVGEHRALVGARFQVSAELAERDDRAPRVHGRAPSGCG